MEDAATAEISRVQVWHWATHEVRAAEGTTITRALVKDMVNAQGVKFQVHAQSHTIAYHVCTRNRCALRNFSWLVQCDVSSVAAVLHLHVRVHV
jgi:malate synthase